MASSPAQIPPGGTFFDTVKKSFKDVPIDAANDNAISTDEFCDAAESLVTLFDILGSVAFKPVKSDMTGNLTKIRSRQKESPSTSQTLQSLVLSELNQKKHTAAEGLMWLNRGLDFTAQALRRNSSNASEELSDSFRSAYTETLKPHHSFVVKPIFSAAMSATPYRKDFYAKMASGPEGEAKLKGEMEEWLGGLEKCVDILKAFYGKKDVKW